MLSGLFENVFFKELRVNKTSSGENETLEVCRIIAYGS